MNADMPFGGVGQSGYGRYHGIEGFKSFSNPKSIMHKAPLNVFPYTAAFPPYTKRKQLIIRALAKLKGLEKNSPLRWLIHAPYAYGPLAKL